MTTGVACSTQPRKEGGLTGHDNEASDRRHVGRQVGRLVDTLCSRDAHAGSEANHPARARHVIRVHPVAMKIRCTNGGMESISKISFALHLHFKAPVPVGRQIPQLHHHPHPFDRPSQILLIVPPA